MNGSGFNISLAGLHTNKVLDYTRVTANTARILVQTNSATADERMSQLFKEMKGKATPIAASFRWIDKAAGLAVGYASVVNEARVVEDKTLTASYRLMASNMYLDEKDETLWELKSQGGKKVLIRSSDSDLSDLLESVRSTSSSVTPRMSQITASVAIDNDLAAYVRETPGYTPITAYGFCIGKSGDKAMMINVDTQSVDIVDNELVAGYYKVDKNQLTAAMEEGKADKFAKANLTAAFDSKPVIEYYKKVIPYSSQYIQSLVKIIKETAAL